MIYIILGFILIYLLWLFANYTLIPFYLYNKRIKEETEAQRKITFKEFRDIFEEIKTWDNNRYFQESFFKRNPIYNYETTPKKYRDNYKLCVHASIISHWGTGLIFNNIFEFMKFQYYLYQKNKNRSF